MGSLADRKVTYVSETAFLSIVTAAVEVYGQETYGRLLGHCSNGRLVVWHAFPYQTAKRGRRRTYAWVGLNQRVDKRLKTFLFGLTGLDLVGEFHSHPGPLEHNSSRPTLPDDLEDLQEGELQLIISINRNGRMRGWRHLKNGSLTGSIGNYSLRLTAWVVQDGRPMVSWLVCPYASGIDR